MEYLKNIDRVIKSVNLSWKPPKNLKISDWADSFRKLSPESSAESGKWYTSRAEYQREIMDTFNDPNIEKNDAITEVRKASTYYQYDKNGKVTSQRAFKNNKEFIQAEKEASLRVQAGLAEIQANILKADKSSLDIVEARRELIKFMMAYELASFLQGGTGGRTISDQDVENMLRAIGAKGWTTSEAIVGGTLQLLAINSEKKDLYEALNSDDPSRVIGAIYARNKLLPRFRLDYKNDRKMMYNALEDLKNSPEGKDQEKKNLKYQFDENNQPIINEEKLEADAIIGVG